MRTTAATASIAYGIYDGNATTGLANDCAATLGTICNASATLSIVGTQVNVSHAGSAIGIAALGTPELNIGANADQQEVVVTAQGQRAMALFTMSIGVGLDHPNTTISGMTATAIASTIDNGPSSFAYGWSDGIDGDPNSSDGVDNRDVFGGSSAPQVNSCIITATADTANINDAAGVLLRGTTRAMLTNNTIVVNGNISDPYHRAARRRCAFDAHQHDTARRQHCRHNRHRHHRRRRRHHRWPNARRQQRHRRHRERRQLRVAEA